MIVINHLSNDKMYQSNYRNNARKHKYNCFKLEMFLLLEPVNQRNAKGKNSRYCYQSDVGHCDGLVTEEAIITCRYGRKCHIDANSCIVKTS